VTIEIPTNLYQQIMAQKAQAIAKTYTSDKAAWQTAADKLRSPFWDWAAPPVHFPAVLKAQTVQITTPTGVKSVSNPLYSYKVLNNPEINNWFPNDYLGTQKQTLRYPNQATNTSNDDFDDRAVAEDPTTSGVVSIRFQKGKIHANIWSSGTCSPKLVISTTCQPVALVDTPSKIHIQQFISSLEVVAISVLLTMRHSTHYCK
jgi:hypothetical protein